MIVLSVKWLLIGLGAAAIVIPALYSICCLAGVNPLIGRTRL
jgi:hypothetical protein